MKFILHFKLSILFLLILCGCTTTYKNQMVLNKPFPKVEGKNLKKTPIKMPKHFVGNYTVLLIGYKQNAQFDIDRWILGLTDSKIKIRVYELPTVAGMFPRLISEKIDNGMRSGIPEDLWVDVITLYGNNAQRIVKFTGNEKPLNARVMLLNPEGKIVFFHDYGYGVPYLKQLLARLSNKKM